MKVLFVVVLFMIIIYLLKKIKILENDCKTLTKRVDYYEGLGINDISGINCKHSIYMVSEHKQTRSECLPYIRKYK